MQNISGKKIDIRKWESLLNTSPFSTPFHTIQYYEAVNKVSQFEAIVVAIQRESGEYGALAVATIQMEKGLMSWFTRRAIIYGGILLAPDAENCDIKTLLDYLEKELYSKSIYIEIRNYFNYERYKLAFLSSGWEYSPHLNIKTSLFEYNINEAIQKFTYNRRREIRLTLSEGLCHSHVESESEINAIYQMLRELYAMKVGLPLPPIEYFVELWKTDLMKIFKVTDGNTIVAGSFCPYLEGKAIYTFYYCGLRSYKKNTWPTHLAVLAAIEFAIRENLCYVDFMGGGIGEENKGIRKYKLEFGGKLLEEGRFLKINRPLIFHAAKFAINYYKKINIKNGIR